MLYLAFIFHMHQPYYKNLLTRESYLPWVRLHGIKDYLDMVEMLEKYPLIHQTFNMVPSLLEQIEDYAQEAGVKDKFLEFSYKNAGELTQGEKEFIRENFFMINKERVISIFPRYYELYLKKEHKSEFSQQDYLDLQAWFNLAWFDPYYRNNIPELRHLTAKGRFFSEEEKRVVLEQQKAILKNIIQGYEKFMAKGQIEVTLSPYYHPILPLLYNTKTAREANLKTALPHTQFAYPEDARAQIEEGIIFYKERFKRRPQGMWPSEEAVSEHIVPFIIDAGINWIVTDEAILSKSLKLKKRDTMLLYQPHVLKRKNGNLNAIFRDRNLSDLIGFVYHKWETKKAVEDLIKHLENIASAFKKQDILVTIAMDGENAWEYYPNDGHDFLELLYARISEANFLKAVTVSEYLKDNPPKSQIKHLGAGSWIYGDFLKWIGNPYKNKAWEYLALARKELDTFVTQDKKISDLAKKQIYIAEGSDWFWWYGEHHADFDKLFRTHLSNFYTIIGKEIPGYLKEPLRGS